MFTVLQMVKTQHQLTKTAGRAKCHTNMKLTNWYGRKENNNSNIIITFYPNYEPAFLSLYTLLFTTCFPSIHITSYKTFNSEKEYNDTRERDKK